MEEKKAPKKRLGQKKEPPEAFMASFFAGLEIYQTKMLVRYFPFMFTVAVFKTNYESSVIFTIMYYIFTELPGEKLLQSPLLGTFCCLCYQLYSSFLQSKLNY